MAFLKKILTGSSTILAETEEKVAQGAVGILAVIIKNRLYIASIGDCGALLCRQVLHYMNGLKDYYFLKTLNKN